MSGKTIVFNVSGDNEYLLEENNSAVFSNIPIGGFFKAGRKDLPLLIESEKIYVKTSFKTSFCLQENKPRRFEKNTPVSHVYNLEIERTYED